MASLNMSGPFPLNEREIDQNIRKKNTRQLCLWLFK